MTDDRSSRERDHDPVLSERARIRSEYDAREHRLPADFYALHREANLFVRHGQERALRWALEQAGSLPLGERRVLEVGCGDGSWQPAFLAFGARAERLAGVDLDAGRLGLARRRDHRPALVLADGARLPFPDGAFDVVFQSTVFSSILDARVRARVAAEMVRVLAPGGAVLWYDFAWNNPNNRAVVGLGAAELRRLFPGRKVRVRAVTLAPPLARRLVPLGWTFASLLEGLGVLNTHRMAVIR